MSDIEPRPERTGPPYIIGAPNFSWEDPSTYDSPFVKDLVQQVEQKLTERTPPPDHRTEDPDLVALGTIAQVVARNMPYEELGTRAIGHHLLEYTEAPGPIGYECIQIASATRAVIKEFGKQRGLFQDAVLVVHGWESCPKDEHGYGYGHMTVFVPSKAVFVEGSFGQVFTPEEYLRHQWRPVNFQYLRYPRGLFDRFRKVRAHRSERRPLKEIFPRINWPTRGETRA